MPAWPRLAITTSLHTAIWDGDKLVRVLHEGKGLYYGVTWDRNRVYTTARARFAGPYPDNRIVPLGGDAPLIYAPFAETHQIHATPEGVLYATFTHFEHVMCFGPEGGETAFIGERYSHPNSVWIAPDTGRMWLCQHNFSTKTGKPSDILCVNRETFQIEYATQLGWEGHNVFVSSGVVHTCNSLGGTFVRAPLSGGKIETAEVGGFPRGVAALDDVYIVGSSKRGQRESRHDGDAWMTMVDRKTMKVLDQVTLPGVGQLSDIRAVAGDEAHNGLPMPCGL